MASSARWRSVRLPASKATDERRTLHEGTGHELLGSLAEGSRSRVLASRLNPTGTLEPGICGGLDRTDDWYVGDGWYSDGDGRDIDCRTGWALHPYPLLWARMAGPYGDGGRGVGFGQVRGVLAVPFVERGRNLKARVRCFAYGVGPDRTHQGRPVSPAARAAAPAPP
ncbi:DUF2264 domain-containing protein [Streptomyces sp. NPDC079020]|uniref:DUF2264 domain-containing protein n=1 Tax=Streptomyces sp. NPDC079020 TaxID=3365722 RepID=UPI0037D760F8